jgi:hypothetical protein
MMYRVQWEIDIEADTPEDAARQAFEIMHDPTSIASVFDVKGEDGITHQVDTADQL